MRYVLAHMLGSLAAIAIIVVIVVVAVFVFSLNGGSNKTDYRDCGYDVVC